MPGSVKILRTMKIIIKIFIKWRIKMDDREKEEIGQIVANILYKKYGDRIYKDLSKNIRDIADSSIELLKVKIREIKQNLEEECLNRISRRFRGEIEPMLEMKFGKMAELASKYCGDSEFEKMFKEELVDVFREKAREWARKVAISEVRFKFDDIWED